MTIRITQHAHKRFKERLRVKNVREMIRRAFLALTRGDLVPEKSVYGKICYEHNGHQYIFGDNNTALITVFRANHPEKNEWKKELLRETKAIASTTIYLSSENFLQEVTC